MIRVVLFNLIMISIVIVYLSILPLFSELSNARCLLTEVNARLIVNVEQHFINLLPPLDIL